MPTSPCVNCGTETEHTDNDRQPLCELCTERLMWQNILVDIVQGKIEIQEDDRGRPIIPGHIYPEE
jgi:hypothetical protein